MHNRGSAAAPVISGAARDGIPEMAAPITTPDDTMPAARGLMKVLPLTA
jgi:hypothetical protein